MIKDLSLHGVMGGVEFTVLVRGEDARSVYFYEESPSHVRFFSKGNEFSITPEGITYKGIGGGFCEYMFGMEKPREDIVNREVLNRLVMFGAYADRDESLLFTNNTEGTDSFGRLFLQGHAIKNYYFFVCSSQKEEPKKRQKRILGRVGKLLKRSVLVSDNSDLDLMEVFYERLDEPDSTAFIFKLLHKGNEEFYRTFGGLYSRDRTLSPDDERYIAETASANAIDYYQQERMKIDIMYKHPENRRIVDEYRDILLATLGEEIIRHSELARLRRLRTLRIRNNIPAVLFETLDEFLLKGRKLQEVEEPEYLREARSILENLFFHDPSLKSHIIGEDIVRLIMAKHRAYSNGETGFEGLLLDAGKACDETARETNDYSLFEEFSGIVTYFDRYDHVQVTMSQVAFNENFEFAESSLRSLLGNKKEFDALEKGLFEGLFVKDIVANKYITRYGRKKIKTLSESISKVSTGDASIKDVVGELTAIAGEERLYRHVHTALREKLRGFYPRLDVKEGRDEIRQDIAMELGARGIAEDLPEWLFEKAFLDLRKESFYINNLLPGIIKAGDTKLREDFIKNSGLDRFYIESIEREYFTEKGLDIFLLNLIREDEKELSSIVQGGDRT